MAKLDLGKQVGPLPLGAWIAVVAGGLGIALWARNQDSGEVVVTEDVSGVPGVGEGAIPGQYIDVTPRPPSESDEITYASNEAWGQAAVNWLIAQGYQPGLASSAITKALAGGVDIDGNKMSIQEWALWSLALTKFGSPPYPVNVAPPSNTPGPVTPTEPPDDGTPSTPKPPTNKVPAHWTYKAKQGDTLSSISQKYYGTPNRWREIYNFNLKYRNPATAAIIRARGPNLFFAGSTWWVPK